MAIGTDILFSQVMIDAIQKNVIRRGSFFRDRFFANVKEFAEQIGQYDVINNTVNEAKFSGYNGQAINSQMNSWETKFIPFECCRISRTIHANDLMQRLPGLTAYDIAEKAPELQRLSWEECEADAIHTEELLCVNAIKTGKVTVKDANGVSKDLINNSSNSAIVSGSFGIDLSTEGKVVQWVMGLVQAVIAGGTYQGATLPGKGSAPNTLVVGADIGAAIAKAFADGRAHAFDGAVNPALDYARECIAFLGNVCGVEVFVCGDSNLLGAKAAIIGSAGDSIMAYGPTYVPAGESGIQRLIGRRSMYSIIGKDPVAVQNILQLAPCPVVRRPADVLYVVTTGTIS